MFPTKAPRVDRDVLAFSSHLTNKRGPWWHDRGLLKLNLLIMIPLMSEYVQGYDASLINNVQQLKSWQSGMQLSLFFSSSFAFLYVLLGPKNSGNEEENIANK